MSARTRAGNRDPRTLAENRDSHAAWSFILSINSRLRCGGRVDTITMPPLSKDSDRVNRDIRGTGPSAHSMHTNAAIVLSKNATTATAYSMYRHPLSFGQYSSMIYTYTCIITMESGRICAMSVYSIGSARITLHKNGSLSSSVVIHSDGASY